MPLRYWAIILVLAAGWGSSFFLNEILLRELHPLWVGAGRVTTGALGCWLWLGLRGQARLVPVSVIGHLVVFGLLQYGLPLTIFPLSQQYITSSAAGIINAMTPIMVVLVSHFWPGGERATLLKSFGVASGFFGIVLLAVPSLQGGGESAPLALAFALLAPLSYGLALNYLRIFDGMDRTVLTAWALLVGASVMVPIAATATGAPQISQAETWVALGVIGFVLTAAAFIILFWLIPKVGGTAASTVTFIAPVAALLLGVLVLEETVLPIQYAGLAAIFGGLVFIDGRLFRWSRKDQPLG